MPEGRWVELKKALPEEAKKGDRDAIREWLANWGRERGREAMVWIDLRTDPEQVRAGTSIDIDKIVVPEDLLARFNDASEQFEIWHNHPEIDGQPSSAIPGGEDIASAMRPGVTSIFTVDNEGRCTRIEAGARAVQHPAAVQRWTRRATMLEQTALDMEAGKTADDEAKHYRDIDAAEAAVGAAVAIGLIRAKGLSEAAIAKGGALAEATNRRFGTPAEMADGLAAELQDQTTLGNPSRRRENRKRGRAKCR